MNEAMYQRELIRKIRNRIPGCFVMKNDSQEYQGVPDILILYNNNWAMLEVKMSEDAYVQPNQEFYITKFGGMAFASFVTPETEEAILNDLQHAFGLEGSTRFP
jgi:hypothetical protein